jgi:hypothetical protein
METEMPSKANSQLESKQGEMHEMAESGTNIIDAGIDESEMTPEIPTEITME